MAENSKAQTSVTERVLLTGGLITSGAIGWSLFRMFKSQLINCKEIMYAVSFGGGIGILGSVIVFKCRKSSDSQMKSITSEKDASNMTVRGCETSALATLLDRVNEWDKIFAHEAGKGIALDQKISRNISQEAEEISSKYEDLTKRLNDLDRRRQRNKLENLPADKQFKTCYNEGIGSSKAKLREEITAHINELKGYVQGTIDPLPLAKNFQIRSTELNDEKRGQIAMIIKEYANSLVLKLEKVIDEFVYSVCEAGKIFNNKEHKVKNALETLGVPEKDLSTTPLKIEMSQYYSALEKATKSKSRASSCQRSRNVSGACARPLESAPNHSLREILWTKTSEPQSPTMPKLETPTGVSKPREVNKPDCRIVEKLKSQDSQPPSKLVLNEEQINFLNLLKSEL